MPPKSKKGKKGKKGKGKEKGERVKTPEATEKELLLKAELEKVTDELENAKIKVEDLLRRKENDWLQQEAQKVRVESHEYMSYMDKKTTKRQTTIVTLSDYNKQEIQNVLHQRKIMEDEFDGKKKVLEELLLEKQHILEKTKQELTDLQEYKNLQSEQMAKIKELEHKVTEMRAHHTKAMQELKEQFFKKKREFQNDSLNQIQTLEKKANKEALLCLANHTNGIKQENRNLREELMNLIHSTRALNEHQRQLEEQRRQLIIEQNYANDLKKIREVRQQKKYKNVPLLNESLDSEQDSSAG